MAEHAPLQKHWQGMEPALQSRLLVGDILYGSFDDLATDGLSVRRLVVARPSEERIFLVSTSMAPGDEKPADAQELLVTRADGQETTEVDGGWRRREKRVALRAAEDAVDGTIEHAWLTLWGASHLHLVLRVARAGLHDSLQTLSVTRPAGPFLRETSTAKLIGFRPMPKRFLASGHANVWGRLEANGKVRIR
jgi:hypothetical protein